METVRRINSTASAESLAERIERLKQQLANANAEQITAYLLMLGEAGALAKGIAENTHALPGMRERARVFVQTLDSELAAMRALDMRANAGITHAYRSGVAVDQANGGAAGGGNHEQI